MSNKGFYSKYKLLLTKNDFEHTARTLKVSSKSYININNTFLAFGPISFFKNWAQNFREFQLISIFCIILKIGFFGRLDFLVSNNWLKFIKIKAVLFGIKYTRSSKLKTRQYKTRYLFFYHVQIFFCLISTCAINTVNI